MTPELEIALHRLVNAARWVRERFGEPRAHRSLVEALDAVAAAGGTTTDQEFLAAVEQVAIRVAAQRPPATPEPLPLCGCRAPLALDWPLSVHEPGCPAAAPAPPGVPLGKITRTVSPPAPAGATASTDNAAIPLASGTCPECHERLRLHGRYAYCASTACPCFAPPGGRDA